MDGGTKDLDKGEQMKYGRQLLPQSIYEDPYAEQNQQMTTEEDNSNPTPPPQANVQAEQPHQAEDHQENDQADQPTKPKTWMKIIRCEELNTPPLSGPGPSGFRPEFITDLMTVRKKCVTRRLKKALSTFFSKAGNGELPREMRWILGSGAMFLEKTWQNYPQDSSGVEN
eukprot:16447187-Heterocapsa_arctica.AAC.1